MWKSRRLDFEKQFLIDRSGQWRLGVKQACLSPVTSKIPAVFLMLLNYRVFKIPLSFNCSLTIIKNNTIHDKFEIIFYCRHYCINRCIHTVSSLHMQIDKTYKARKIMYFFKQHLDKILQRNKTQAKWETFITKAKISFAIGFLFIYFFQLRCTELSLEDNHHKNASYVCGRPLTYTYIYSRRTLTYILITLLRQCVCQSVCVFLSDSDSIITTHSLFHHHYSLLPCVLCCLYSAVLWN